MILLRVFVAVAGVAGPPASGDALELSWTAPEECPSRAELETMIHAQVVTVPDDAHVRVDGRIETTPASAFVIRLTLEREGTVEAHTITDTSCDAVTRQAATVVATSLDPFGLPAPPPPPEEAPPTPEAPTPDEAPEVAPDTAPDVNPDPSKPSIRAYVNTAAGMSANFFAGQSMAPSVSGSLGVELGALRIGARGGGSAGARDGALGLSMNSWDLGLSLGGTWRFARAVLGVRGDVGAGSVIMRRDEQRQSAAWLWTSALLGGGVAITRRFTLIAEAGVGVSINRPQVVFADAADTAVAIAPLAFPRAHLGIDYRFR